MSPAHTNTSDDTVVVALHDEEAPGELLYDTRGYHMSPLLATAPPTLLSATSLTLDMERQASMAPGTDLDGGSAVPLLRLPTTDVGGSPPPPPHRQVEARRKKKIIWFSVVGAVSVAVVLAVLLPVLLTRGRSKDSYSQLAEGPAGADPSSSLLRAPGSQNPDSTVPGALPPTTQPQPAINVLYTPPTLKHDFENRPRRVESVQGVVAADTGRCSQLGASILEEGGNAVDAAIATVLCQGVVNPFASGPGGGCFVSIRDADGQTHFIDAREVAPRAATADMFKGKPANASILGGLAVAVPLELKGLEMAFKKFGSGKVTWQRLVQPSASMAGHPIFVHPYLQAMIEASFDRIKERPLMAETFLIKQADGSWRAPRTQEMCCARPQLADTLQKVAEEGTGWLYSGQAAFDWAQDVFDAGGIMTADDIELAEPEVSELSTMQVGSFQLHVPPLPSSAAVLGLALQVLMGFPNPPDTDPTHWIGKGTASKEQMLYQYRMVESMKEAFAMRANLGDRDAIKDNSTLTLIDDVLASLNSALFAYQLRSDLDADHVLPVSKYGRQFNPFKTKQFALPDDNGTCHVSVVDANRMAVSITSTINGHFGSYVISPSTGILMNNEMDDFSKPDEASQWELPPQVANYIAPGKRPLSSMSPIIITQDNDSTGQNLRLVLGASGGPHILTSVLQTIVRTLVLDWDIQDAINVPRVHHQFMPYQVSYENYTMPSYLGSMEFKVTPQFRDYLEQKGNNMKATNYELGVVQAIFAVPGQHTLVAVSDPRKDGAPAAQQDK